jgi:predicted Fe-S protein YdhL (DUF1289 family)
MTDTPWRRDEIESPCVRVCVLHPTSGLCLGCYRSAQEIASWSGMPSHQRSSIMDELPSRASAVRGTRRGGRASRLGSG